MKVNDLAGKTYGKLTVLRRDHNSKWNSSTWLCRCECGVETVVVAGSLVTGRTKSCGCMQRDLARQMQATRIRKKLIKDDNPK